MNIGMKLQDYKNGSLHKQLNRYWFERGNYSSPKFGTLVEVVDYEYEQDRVKESKASQKHTKTNRKRKTKQTKLASKDNQETTS